MIPSAAAQHRIPIKYSTRKRVEGKLAFTGFKVPLERVGVLIFPPKKQFRFYGGGEGEEENASAPPSTSLPSNPYSLRLRPLLKLQLLADGGTESPRPKKFDQL